MISETPTTTNTLETGAKPPAIDKTRVLDMETFRLDLQETLAQSDILTREDDTPKPPKSKGPNEGKKPKPSPPGPNRRLQMDIAYAQKEMFLAHNRGMKSFELPVEMRANLENFIEDVMREVRSA